MTVIETGRRLEAHRKLLRTGANCESIGLRAFRQRGVERFPEAIPANLELALSPTACRDRAAQAAEA